MVAAPDRIDTLERRIAALEAEIRARPRTEDCGLCGGAMKVTAERPDPHFGVFGGRQRTLVCQACGHQVEARFDPRKP